MWFEKIIYAISKGLSDIEKLKKIEAEKVARSIQAGSFAFEMQQAYSPSNITGPSDSFNE